MDSESESSTLQGGPGTEHQALYYTLDEATRSVDGLVHKVSNDIDSLEGYDEYEERVESYEEKQNKIRDDL